MGKIKVAVVTVDYNGHGDTAELLESAKKLRTDGLEVQWIVVDNGSKEWLGDLLDSRIKKTELSNSEGVEILQTGRNLGFAGGYNHGLRYALASGSDYIFVINNDTLITDPDILVKLMAVFAQNPEAGVVAPKMLFAPGFEFFKDKYTKKDEGKVLWWAGSDFDWNNIATKHRGIDEIDKGQYDRIEQTDTISGCCFMVKSEVLDKVGLFEEKYFAYLEDVELMHRIKQAGYCLWYAGETAIYHKVSRTSGIGSPKTDYFITRNRLFFGMKYANWKTKQALLRQAGTFLLSGREAQKNGVRDFILDRGGDCHCDPPLAEKQSPRTLFERLLRFLRQAQDLRNDKGNAKTLSVLPVTSMVIFPTDLSIIIVNYKTKELTLKLLASIFADKAAFSRYKVEVIVLDNASEDGIEGDIKAKYKTVKFIQNTKNTGFAGGYNKAIGFSKGRYILLLNSDIEVSSGGLEKMVEFARAKGDRVVVVNKLKLPDGSMQKSCFNLPTIGRAIREYWFGQTGSYSLYLPEGTQPVQVEGAVMASFLIPRAVWNEVGRLSEESFMYFEDIEYCRRVKRAGIPVWYLPEVVFDHHHGASSKKLKDGKAQVLLNNGSKAYFGVLRKWLIDWVIRIGAKIGRVILTV